MPEFGYRLKGVVEEGKLAAARACKDGLAGNGKARATPPIFDSTPPGAAP
jgi:hypothetical protein